MTGDDRRRSREERIRASEKWLSRDEPLLADAPAFRAALGLDVEPTRLSDVFCRLPRYRGALACDS